MPRDNPPKKIPCRSLPCQELRTISRIDPQRRATISERTVTTVAFGEEKEAKMMMIWSVLCVTAQTHLSLEQS